MIKNYKQLNASSTGVIRMAKKNVSVDVKRTWLYFANVLHGGISKHHVWNNH